MTAKRLQQTISQAEYDELPEVVQQGYLPDADGMYQLSLGARGQGAGAIIAAGRLRAEIGQAIHGEYAAPELRRQGLPDAMIPDALKRLKISVSPQGEIEYIPLTADGTFMVSIEPGRLYRETRELVREMTRGPGPAQTEKPAREKRVVREAEWQGTIVQHLDDGTITLNGQDIDRLGLRPSNRLSIARLLGLVKGTPRPGNQTADAEEAKRLASLPPTERMRQARRAQAATA